MSGSTLFTSGPGPSPVLAYATQDVVCPKSPVATCKPVACFRHCLVADAPHIADSQCTTIERVAAKTFFTWDSHHPLPDPTITPNTVLPTQGRHINASAGAPAHEVSHIQCR